MWSSAFFVLLLLFSSANSIFQICYINQTELVPPPAAPPPIKVNGKTYIIETSFLASWYKADQFCKLHGMNLASINNIEENNVLGQTIKSFGLNKFKFWTSGNDLDSYNSYVWQSTGSSLSFTSWNQNEPNHNLSENETEHCIQLSDHSYSEGWWNDCVCSSKLFFVCEKY